MQKCYVGESFELAFKITDPSDSTRTVDTVTYSVYAPDGTISQAGAASVDEDGHTVRFRFLAETAGVNTIKLAWSMGQDRWICPHLMDVREA